MGLYAASMRRRHACLLFLASALPMRALAAGPALQPAQPSWDALLRLSARLRALDADGLNPGHYNIPPDARAASDPQGYTTALYAAAYAALGDLLQGRVRSLPDRPDIRREAVAMVAWQARLYGHAEPSEVIEEAALLPPGMEALRLALQVARAQVAAGGWPSVPTAGGTIEPASTDPERVPALRARIAAEDAALAATVPVDPALYDETLLEAVRRWQAANGLEPDGRVGPATLVLMNRPAQARVNQIRVAMDMRRAAPRPQPGRRIEVNIPDYRLKLLDGTRMLLDMAVIVGKPNRATPMLSVTMTTVQFNPPWGVPERNAREDLLPKFRRDPRAMIEKGFRIYQFIGGERVEVDPLTVDWASIDPKRIPYFFRQDAGDSNALGRIKFIMPNSDDIYLHDTPDRHLFSRPGRAFSSGCIRLDKPMELLDLVLEGTTGWDRAKADTVLESKQTTAVGLRRPLPVRLFYQTVTVEQAGVRIRPDIYGLDAAYARALDQRGAAAPAVAAAAPRQQTEKAASAAAVVAR
ncbi:L,D-transpeptidase family protein [Roseomonas sp. ACRSG]|nr:L,D-transpeptidase family protein [Roseomonas sp. ACRSG]